MYSASEIANIVGGKLYGNGQTRISKLSCDSRAITFPEETVFVALKTDRNDGHRFIESLEKNNVKCFLVSEISKTQETGDKAFILVENTLQALQKLVSEHRKRFSIPVIGITGSNGKTIVKEWLYQLLAKDFRITRSPRSYNSQIGVPFSVWEINNNTELGIFEAGISMPNEMDSLETIIKPSIGVFTNLGAAHQENFSSLKLKCAEKLKLFRNSGFIVYCKDDKLVDICVQQYAKNAQKFAFGQGKDCDLRITNVSCNSGFSEVCCEYKNESITYTIPFTDNASIENSLLCLSVLLLLGIKKDIAAKRLSMLEPVAMRLEVKNGQNGCTLINDSYNSDIISLEIALDYLVQQAAIKKNKKTVVLSDIYQTGENADALYKKVQSLVLTKGISRFIGIGSEILNHKSLFSEIESYFFATTKDFLEHISRYEFKNETILLKGSRDFRFEEITDKLSEIVHETALEVNLSALIRNFNYFRSYLKPGTKIMSMVKAYAYGSGDIEVARTLQSCGCDYLAVAVADEGATLRTEGIHIPIVVMNPEQNSFRKIFEYNLEPEIYSFGMLDTVINEAKLLGITDYPIHIKIDTGMHRLGFENSDIDNLINILKNQNHVVARSVFSHLVGSDSPDFDDFTKVQLQRFDLAKNKLQEAMPYRIMCHILNSAGIERYSDYQYDMVRLGIGHYGISALPSQKLEEVCTLKTNILQIKKLDKNETVGYSRKGKLNRDSVIGAIPIGYADGIDRHLGNGNGKVIVNGKRVPIIGNVCMDVCMIDLTDVPAKEGDEVIIFGPELSVNEVAEWLGTIPYEILTSVSRRVRRVYFKE